MKAKRADVIAWALLISLPVLLLAILFSHNQPSTNEVVDHLVILSFVGYAIKLIAGRR